MAVSGIRKRWQETSHMILYINMPEKFALSGSKNELWDKIYCTEKALETFQGKTACTRTSHSSPLPRILVTKSPS